MKEEVARSLKCKEFSVSSFCLRTGVTPQPAPPPPPTTTTTTTKTTVTSCAGRIIHEGERRRGKGGSVSAKSHSVSSTVCVFKAVPFMSYNHKVEALQDEISLSIAPHLAPERKSTIKVLILPTASHKVCKEFVTKRRSVALTRQHCATPELFQSRCSTST